MTTSVALSLAVVAMAALLVVLGAGIVVLRPARRRSASRRTAVRALARPALLLLLAEDDPVERSRRVEELMGVDRRTWQALKPGVGELLGKLRGEARDSLSELVRRRGMVERARRQGRGPGSVRRARAAELLGSLEDPDVTGDLIRLLADRDAEVRQVAARSLGRAGDARGAEPLLLCLRGGAVPPRTVSQALLRLGAGAHPALTAALEDPDALVRAVAVEILGLSAAVAPARGVEGALRDDPAMDVRIRAARALGRVGAAGSLAALLRATHAEHPGLRAVSGPRPRRPRSPRRAAPAARPARRPCAPGGVQRGQDYVGAGPTRPACLAAACGRGGRRLRHRPRGWWRPCARVPRPGPAGRSQGMNVLESVVRPLLDLAEVPVLVYFLAINTVYLVLIVLASLEFARQIR